jgi:hypothetical protein
MTSGSSSPTKASQRGLLRLMLKLPAIRGRLQVLARNSPSLSDLLEAYEEAATMLDRLATDGGVPDDDLRREYEAICSELEADVIEFCLTHQLDNP